MFSQKFYPNKKVMVDKLERICLSKELGKEREKKNGMRNRSILRFTNDQSHDLSSYNSGGGLYHGSGIKALTVWLVSQDWKRMILNVEKCFFKLSEGNIGKST